MISCRRVKPYGFHGLTLTFLLWQDQVTSEADDCDHDNHDTKQYTQQLQLFLSHQKSMRIWNVWGFKVQHETISFPSRTALYIDVVESCGIVLSWFFTRFQQILRNFQCPTASLLKEIKRKQSNVTEKRRKRVKRVENREKVIWAGRKGHWLGWVRKIIQNR